MPKEGVGVSSFEKIADFARLRHLSFFQALDSVEFIGLSPKLTKAFKFRDLIDNYSRMQEFLSVTELLEDLLDKSEYRDMLKAEKTIESQSRLENLDELLSVTKNFENTNEDKSLIAFLTDLALVADIDSSDDDGQKS